MALSKGDVGVVDGLFITGLTPEQVEEFNGREVEVTGDVEVVSGQDLVNEAGEISQGHEGPRSVMSTVDSISAIE